MASAKETPRQRMVGMMYLVLTALLALQVSSSLIYKFQYLNESLEKASAENDAWNGQKLIRIQEEITKRGNKKEEVDLLTSAKHIRAESQNIIGYIESIKKDLIKESGGYDSDGSLKGAKEETKVEVMMIGANKNGKAYELKGKLNDFVKFMNKNSNSKYSPMALDGKEDPLFKDKGDQKNKDYAELNFGQTPLVASLAILSEYQSRITAMQTTSITSLGEKVGVKDFMVDKMVPMVSPVSRVVAAGTKYEADLFLVGTSTSLQPKMEFNTNAIPVDNNGVGKISFTASGGNYVSGLAKKTWTGKIISKTPEGKDTTYIVYQDYYVAQPLIEVEAEAVKVLYKNCGNKLNIQVPALGNSYNPRITAEGATLTNGEAKGSVTVVPTGSQVTIKVNSDGNYIGQERYGVKLVPLPTLEVRVNNTIPNIITGVDASTARTLSIKAIPDREFARFLPQDAIYTISKVNVRTAKGRIGRAPKEFNTSNINLASFGGFNPGERLIIEVLEVKRKTFRGDWEVVNMPAGLSTFQVNLN